MKQEKKMNRRRFIKTSGAAFATAVGFPSIIPSSVFGKNGNLSPGNRITIGCIGVGGMGRGHLRYEGSRLVAICDVDKNHIQRALKEVGPEVRTYSDFRDVIAQPDIDIIHIATPPHWHALMSIAAAEAGKDVWCEKPMTRTIGEGQAVVKAIQKYDRIFRINTWFRFRGGFYGFNTTVKPVKKIVENGS